MKYYIGCDAHKKYSVFAGISEAGEIIPAQRVEHDRESYRSFLKNLPPASRIAVESVGNWYWLIEEIEKAGHIPALVNAGKRMATNTAIIATTTSNSIKVKPCRGRPVCLPKPGRTRKFAPTGSLLIADC